MAKVKSKEMRTLNAKYQIRKVGDSDIRGMRLTPSECHIPENCISCYVVTIYDGDVKYCGNPKNLLKYQAMNEDAEVTEERKMSANPFIEAGKIYIPRGCGLKCENCGNQWATRQARKPTIKTGIRCPKCHSREVLCADGTPVPGRPVKEGRKVTVTQEPSTETGVTAETPQFEKTRRAGKSDRGHTVTVERDGNAIDIVRRRLSASREVPPAQETAVEPTGGRQPPPPVARGTEAFLTTEELAEIFDPETFEMLHELEVEALCKKLNRPRLRSYQKAVKSLGKKSALIMRLVFRDPDLALALKIVIGLYILQQLALIGAIFTGSDMGLTVEAPKTEEDESEEPEEE